MKQLEPWQAAKVRKALGVGMWGTPGSRRLHLDNSAKGAAAARARVWTAAERRAKRRQTRRLGLPRHLDTARAKRWVGKGWTAEAVALLGTMPDEVLARQLGKTVNAVRLKRTRAGAVANC